MENLKCHDKRVRSLRSLKYLNCSAMLAAKKSMANLWILVSATVLTSFITGENFLFIDHKNYS